MLFNVAGIVFLFLLAFKALQFSGEEAPADSDEDFLREKVYRGGEAFTCSDFEKEKQATAFAKAKRGYVTGFYLGCADPINLGLFLVSSWNPTERPVTLINVGANKGNPLS